VHLLFFFVVDCIGALVNALTSTLTGPLESLCSNLSGKLRIVLRIRESVQLCRLNSSFVGLILILVLIGLIHVNSHLSMVEMNTSFILVQDRNFMHVAYH